MLWLEDEEVILYNKEVENVVEVLKVKILEAIKHHVKCGYSNKRIVMTKQHSYHVTCKYDAYVLDKALELLSYNFRNNCIPITVEYGDELLCFFGEDNTFNGEKDIPIIFNIIDKSIFSSNAIYEDSDIDF